MTVTLRLAKPQRPSAQRSRRCSPSSAASSSARSDPLRLALACLLARGHLLIEDIPGVGKTTLAQALAADARPELRAHPVHERPAAGRRARRVDLRRAQRRRSASTPGPIFNSVVLADEINRAPPKTQSALLEAMEERQVSHRRPDAQAARSVLRHRDAEPVEQIGAYPLPESQLDRFLMAIELGYPDAAAERELLAGGDRRARIGESPPLCRSARRSPSGSAKRRDIHVAPALLDYVQALLAATRGHPRAATQRRRRRAARPVPARRTACCSRPRAPGRCSPARPMVLPEDVQAVFPSVAGHRLAGGTRAGALQAQALLRAVPLP